MTLPKNTTLDTVPSSSGFITLLHKWAPAYRPPSCLFPHCRPRPISSKSRQYQTQIFTHAIILKTVQTSRWLATWSLPALPTSQNIPPHSLAIDGIEPYGYNSSSCHGPLGLSDPQTLHCAAEGISLGRMRPFSSPHLLWESPCPPPLLGSDPSSLWASGQPHVVETFHLVQPCPSTTQLSVFCVTVPGGHILFLNQLPATLRVWLLSSSLCRIASFWRVNKKGMCRLTWSPFHQENEFSYTCQWKVSRLTYISLSKMAKESGEVSI